MKTKALLVIASALTVAAHGAALLEADGLVTEKVAGWRFEASGAKGGAAFNPLEGWYPDKGGKLVSPRIAIPKAGAYYKLSFTGSAPVRSYETVALYDAAGNMIADNYDVIYGDELKVEKLKGEKLKVGRGESGKRYARVVFAQEGVKEAEVFFQSPKGCTVSDVKFEPATVEDAAKWCDGVYAKLPAVEVAGGGQGLPALPVRTQDALKTGKPWRILMLGDSIMQDTFHSQFHALVKRAYPKSDVTWLVSVRGSTGCWYYCEPENFRKYVADYKPDCVFIGGISGWIHPEMPLNGGPAIESVARRVNEELGAEVVVMTPTLAIDLRVPKGTEQGTAVAPSKFDHAALGDKAWKYDVAAAEELKAICAKSGWPLWDMFTPAYDWLFKTGLPSEFYSRDYVHSGELGKQIIGRIALAYFAAGNKKDDMTADAIVNGVHGYMPDNYVVPKEPEVREKLEWLKDQKLALMMHFGMYSQMGVYESWPLSDADARWSRVQIDWTDDAEAFKRQYWDLWRSFNPVRFQPEKWARLAKDGGFRYLVFTTKHHDGFCLFDTKYTDFKVTNPECPFSKNPRADIVKSVFDAFRAEGLGIAAYFSKPDWHNEDFWEDHGIGRKVSRMPTYDVKAAEVKVRVECEGDGEDLRLRVGIEGERQEVCLCRSPFTFTLKLPLAELRPWSPDHPNLYTGVVELVENGQVVHTRRERFGVRKLEVRGKEFYLNGKPFFVRGFGDDAVYPLTGLSPADRDAHRAHLAKAREAGFNFVRLHTHCELPECFDAADELGIIDNPKVRYFEVCNNGSSWPAPEGLDGEWFQDCLWDAVLAYRLSHGQQPLYGLGSDDTHFYPGSGLENPYTFGDGYIMVRAAELTQSALFEAIHNGDFYASSELDLEDVVFDRTTGTLTVSVLATPGVKCSIRFISSKKGTPLDPVSYVEIPATEERMYHARTVPVYADGIGATVKLVEGNRGERLVASYTLAADDLYVRARVESDAPTQFKRSRCLHPKHHTAWTQPYL